jgi:hypothetical protein
MSRALLSGYGSETKNADAVAVVLLGIGHEKD